MDTISDSLDMLIHELTKDMDQLNPDNSNSDRLDSVSEGSSQTSLSNPSCETIGTQTNVETAVANTQTVSISAKPNSEFPHTYVSIGGRSPLRDAQRNIKYEIINGTAAMKTHFDLMYCFGISRITGDGEKGSAIHQIAFALISLLAILDGLTNLKRFVLEVAKKGDLNHYVTICYYLSGLTLRLYFVKISIFDLDSLRKILHQARTRLDVGQYSSAPRISMLAVGIASVLIITSLSESMYLHHIISGELSTVDVILLRSSGIGRAMFLWTKSNSTNASEILNARFGASVTATTISMGFLGFIVKFFGRLQLAFVRDVILVISLHICHQSYFYKTNILVGCTDKATKIRVASTLWSQYKLIHDNMIEIDVSLGTIFKLIHVDNLLIGAYFLLDILYGGLGIWVIFAAPKIAKICWVYYISPEALDSTDALRKKIHDIFCSFALTGEIELKLTMVLLLDKLATYPIGLGRGNFVVDENFVPKFVGVMASLFMFFVESENSNS